MNESTSSITAVRPLTSTKTNRLYLNHRAVFVILSNKINLQYRSLLTHEGVAEIRDEIFSGFFRREAVAEAQTFGGELLSDFVFIE